MTPRDTFVRLCELHIRLCSPEQLGYLNPSRSLERQQLSIPNKIKERVGMRERHNERPWLRREGYEVNVEVFVSL
jgi:hypothetical protein